MDERLQQFDTAVFGPWRAVTAALGQHARILGTIQMEAGQAYWDIAWRHMRSLNAPVEGADDLAERLRQGPRTADAVRARFQDDALRWIEAHHDLLTTAGALTGDGLASMGTTAGEAAGELNPAAA